VIDRSKRRSDPFVLATLLALVASHALIANASGAACTQFGNPPATLLSSPIPLCHGGDLLGPWNDSDGTPRYSCVYEPPSASASKPLPMIVFLHPSLNDADSVVFTDFLTFLDTADLSGDTSKPGYILLAPEGRNTSHFYTDGDATGLGWDNWYRQFSAAVTTPPENVDAAAIDHFIAAEVATGKVDSNRIYVSGWSNGAAMAYIYGLNRSNIAAIGVYSAPDPWAFSIDPCEQIPAGGQPKMGGRKISIRKIPIANSRVPTYQVHNGCDIVGLCPNSKRMEKRLRKIGVSIADQIIGLASDPTNPAHQDAARRCFAQCGTNPNGDDTTGLGANHHSRWPTDWTQSIFDFFRTHPLSAQ
jgi:poly(3-hydroxybutyrate) depolymerase